MTYMCPDLDVMLARLHVRIKALLLSLYSTCELVSHMHEIRQCTIAGKNAGTHYRHELSYSNLHQVLSIRLQ